MHRPYEELELKESKNMLNALQQAVNVGKKLKYLGDFSMYGGVLACSYDELDIDFGVSYGILLDKVIANLGPLAYIPMKIDGKELSSFISTRKKADFVKFDFRKGEVAIVYNYLHKKDKTALLNEYVEMTGQTISDVGSNLEEFKRCQDYIKEGLKLNGKTLQEEYVIQCGWDLIDKDFLYVEKYVDINSTRPYSDVIDEVDITDIFFDIAESELPYRIDYSDGRYVYLMNSLLKGYTKPTFVKASVKRVIHDNPKFSQNIILIETKHAISGSVVYTIT